MAGDPGPDPSSVARVQSWLDGLHGLRARFVQVFPDGGTGQGVASFAPPGRLRLDYLPDRTMTLVADDGRITFTNARAGSTTRMRAASTPFGLLLDGPVRLGGAVRVTDVQTPTGSLQISLARRDNPASGLLTLVFADPGPGAPLALSRIVAVDAEHRRTTLSLFDQRTGVDFPPKTFVPPVVS